MGVGDGGIAWSFVLLGATGSGKSTLGNVLVEREAFHVGHGAKSCTSIPRKELGIVKSNYSTLQ